MKACQILCFVTETAKNFGIRRTHAQVDHLAQRVLDLMKMSILQMQNKIIFSLWRF